MSDMPEYHIDNIKHFIGKELGFSDWLTIDQDRIDAFADVTIDHNPLHVSPELAADGPFGKTIAHGFLTLSLLSHFASQSGLVPKGIHYAINYGFERIRFMAPVRVGSRVRLRQTLLGASHKGDGRYVFRSRNAIEIEDERTPALLADWLCMLVREEADGSVAAAE